MKTDPPFLLGINGHSSIPRGLSHGVCHMFLSLPTNLIHPKDPLWSYGDLGLLRSDRKIIPTSVQHFSCLLIIRLGFRVAFLHNWNHWNPEIFRAASHVPVADWSRVESVPLMNPWLLAHLRISVADFHIGNNVNPGLINPKRLVNWGGTI